MSADDVVRGVGTALELAGVTAIVAGAVVGTASFLRRLAARRAARGGDAFRDYRRALGRAILLGLEFLVAADIIGTVAISPTLTAVAVLAAIVAIRTFLSFALEVELSGEWPWRRGRERE